MFGHHDLLSVVIVPIGWMDEDKQINARVIFLWSVCNGRAGI